MTTDPTCSRCGASGDLVGVLHSGELVCEACALALDEKRLGFPPRPWSLRAKLGRLFGWVCR